MLGISAIQPPLAIPRVIMPVEIGEYRKNKLPFPPPTASAPLPLARLYRARDLLGILISLCHGLVR